MSRYTIEYAVRAEKELRKVRDVRISRPIQAAIAALADDPRPVGVKKLVGPSGLWRIRVGDWRVVYRVEDGRLVVVVVALGGQGGVYGVV